MTLLGRIRGVKNGRLILAQDLRENLARADKFEDDFVRRVDEFITKNELDVPQEVLPKLEDGYKVEQLAELNLQDADITTVIWATGYSFDFSMVRLSMFDDDGYPKQKRGVTEYPGLFFVGLPWLHNARSGLLWGVAQDADYIASVIDRQTRQRLAPNISKTDSRRFETKTEFTRRPLDGGLTAQRPFAQRAAQPTATSPEEQSNRARSSTFIGACDSGSSNLRVSLPEPR